MYLCQCLLLMQMGLHWSLLKARCKPKAEGQHNASLCDTLWIRAGWCTAKAFIKKSITLFPSYFHTADQSQHNVGLKVRLLVCKSCRFGQTQTSESSVGQCEREGFWIRSTVWQTAGTFTRSFLWLLFSTLPACPPLLLFSLKFSFFISLLSFCSLSLFFFFPKAFPLFSLFLSFLYFLSFCCSLSLSLGVSCGSDNQCLSVLCYSVWVL